MTIDFQYLIDRFEDDMQYDAHSNLIKLSRSRAAKRLLLHGKEALPHIAAHLSQNPPNQQLEIHLCWGMLLDDIAIKLGIWEKPTDFEDIEGWIAWAEKEMA